MNLRVNKDNLILSSHLSTERLCKSNLISIKLWKKISPDWQKTLQPQPWLSPATASKSTYRASVATRSYFPVNTDLFYKLLYLEDCCEHIFLLLLEKLLEISLIWMCHLITPLLPNANVEETFHIATVTVNTGLCKNRVL